MKQCLDCTELFEQPAWDCPACGTTPDRREGFPLLAPDYPETASGFEPEYFKELAAMEAGNFWFRNRNRLLVWALGRYFPQASTFLEVGCGTGYVLSGLKKAYPDLNASGSEVFPEGLHYAAQRLPGVELFQMDARRIPFRDEFDVIGAFDVVEHIEEDQEVLLQMYRALKPGGGMLLTVPQHPFLWGPADEYARHVRRYTRTEMKRKVEQAGFRILRLSSFVSVLLPILMISRLSQKNDAQNYNPKAEFQIPGWLNCMLETALSLEQVVIRAGLSYPAGGSLLVVAQKEKS